ncbi:MAG: GatB/YqeY domain-containing protein [Bacteroidetes bacterium]|nr:GatB/YqeY domain-containing protein [Bacteroidota bacterium]
MSLKEQIIEDLKTAMKSGDKVRLQVVRSIRALLLEYEKSGKTEEMTPEMELGLLTTAAKKRKESIEQFRKGDRNDLAESEEAELKIIQEYLPKQLSEEEIKLEVQRIAVEVGASTKQDFAKLMPAAMQALKGKADGKVVKEIVTSILG